MHGREPYSARLKLPTDPAVRMYVSSTTTDPAVSSRMKLPVGQSSDRRLLFNNPLSLLAQLLSPTYNLPYVCVITTRPEYLLQASPY